MRTRKQDRQACQRCGRGIPPRRRDTGYCSDTCEREQRREDELSVESEQDDQDYPDQELEG